MKIIYGKKFWHSLLEPINPNLSILLGLFNVVYGLWTFLPSLSRSGDINEYLSNYGGPGVWGACIALLGIVMVYFNRTQGPRAQVNAMSANAVAWSFFSAVFAHKDLYDTSWLMAMFIAFYSIIVAANFWVNWEYTGRKRPV